MKSGTRPNVDVVLRLENLGIDWEFLYERRGLRFFRLTKEGLCVSAKIGHGDLRAFLRGWIAAGRVREQLREPFPEDCHAG